MIGATLMLARRSTFTHPSAGAIDLPLLVPAFSSKGFRFVSAGSGKRKRQYSEVAFELAEFAKQPQRAVLVSAYDLHHRYFVAPALNQPESYLKQTAVVFLDSGGYELADAFDSTEPRRTERVPLLFEQSDYEVVLAKFKAARVPLPLVIANYDHGTTRRPLVDQIQSARALFRKYPAFASDFIIKPWKGRYIEPDELTDKDVGNLRGFDIIGVTEKELARDLLDRLKTVAALRRRLNAQGISAPIHIWGGLEPIATPLFFFAGAEIFDGISWLRYAYRDGYAIARESYCVVGPPGLTASNPMNQYAASLNNLSVLSKMTVALQQWVDYEGSDFSMFDERTKEPLQTAYRVLQAKLKPQGGV